jgi:hypothetical protein
LAQLHEIGNILQDMDAEQRAYIQHHLYSYQAQALLASLAQLHQIGNVLQDVDAEQRAYIQHHRLSCQAQALLASLAKGGNSSQCFFFDFWMYAVDVHTAQPRRSLALRRDKIEVGAKFSA